MQSDRAVTRVAVPEQEESVRRIFEWASKLTEEDIAKRLIELRQHFGHRASSMETAWRSSYTHACQRIHSGAGVSLEKQLYIGSLFSREYRVESAGVRHPGLCSHVDQSRLDAGSIRFFLSYDGVGEGATSSLVFRQGVIDSDYHIKMDEAGGSPCAPKPVSNPLLRRSVLFRHLHELGFDNPWTRSLMQSLGDEFSRSELFAALETASGPTRSHSRDSKGSAEGLRWLSDATYEMTFDPNSPLSDRVLLPLDDSGHGGLDEGCFTLLTGDGESYYLAYCVSCNGSRRLPLLLESHNLIHFNITLLGGGASRCRGMAIFPRKFGDRFAALCGRADEALYLMYSENPVVWEIALPLRSPSEPWEALGIRPCGPPLETVAGWLVLYCARGEMGRESIGAMLLERSDPSKVLGYLKQPLIGQAPLSSTTAETSLESTGALIHRERLLIARTVRGCHIEIVQFELDSILSLIVEA